MISHIVACSENNIIGADGKIPWHFPEDLQRFKALTQGATVIMGRKTYESIGHALPLRLNIVLTRREGYVVDDCIVMNDIGEAIKVGQKINGTKVFIIGGEEIYKRSMPYIDSIYLTRVHQTIDGDTSYPDIPDEFKEVDCMKYKDYSYLKYERVNDGQENKANHKCCRKENQCANKANCACGS